MNKKGITLTELLIVLVILSIIIVIVTPGFNDFLFKTKDKISTLNENNLKEAGNMFGQEVYMCQSNADIKALFSKLNITVNNCAEAKAKLEAGVNVSIGFLKQHDYFSDDSNNCNESGTLNIKIDGHKVITKLNSNVKCK